MLPLPEALFLLALHDDRGTVHPAAYIVLDQGLRAAVIGELRSRKRVRIGPDSVELRGDSPTGEPLLDQALALLATAPSPSPVLAWIELLEEGMPDIRQSIINLLVTRGVLSRTVKDLPDLASQEQLPTLDRRLEDRLEERLREILLEGGQVRAWDWHLVSLVCACNLVDNHFKAPELQVAKEQARSVMESDALGSAVAEWRARAEGTWEF